MKKLILALVCCLTVGTHIIPASNPVNKNKQYDSVLEDLNKALKEAVTTLKQYTCPTPISYPIRKKAGEKLDKAFANLSTLLRNNIDNVGSSVNCLKHHKKEISKEFEKVFESKIGIFKKSLGYKSTETANCRLITESAYVVESIRMIICYCLFNPEFPFDGISIY